MQRIEVITGKERRRHWSDEEKLRIVAEAEAPGAIQKDVALRNDVHPNQIYLWRKAFKKARKPSPETGSTFFPVEVITDRKTKPEKQTSPLEVVLNNGRI
ncbi:MAG: IS66-like element accessory protein TnpA, partial [Methyloligellaceae bacterium]